METKDINKAIQELRAHRVNVQRSTNGLRFGTWNECRAMFEEVFKAVDGTVAEYQHLPEYDKIIDWMTDTKGKGLFLQGTCGRGKSIILTGVLPALFLFKFRKVLNPFHAHEIPIKAQEIIKMWSIVIDEVGVEPKANNYGETIEGFSMIINAAEMRLAPVYATTNMNTTELLSRYGIRTLDRISRLCTIVKFEGPSLRK